MGPLALSVGWAKVGGKELWLLAEVYNVIGE